MLDQVTRAAPAYAAPRFELGRHDEVGAGAMRALEGEIAAACGALVDPDLPRVKSTHAARRHVKRARTLVRLLRRVLGAKRADAANAALRDAGRALSGRRDADVLEALARTLAEEAQAPARAALRQVAERASASGDGAGTEIEVALASLERARAALATAEVTRRAPRLVAKALTRLYDQGRGAMKAAREARGDDEALHDWRKRVKDRWHAARLLGPVWPKGSRPRTRKLDRLGELLGADHDLAVLAAAIEAERGAVADRSLDAALALARERQEATRARLFELGRDLYGDKPKAFGRPWRRWAKRAHA